MSAVGVDCVTRVSVKGCSDYLPRVRRIVACMADSAGMDIQEADNAEMILTRLYADAVGQGSTLAPEDSVSITFRVSEDGIVADLPDVAEAAPSPDNDDLPASSVCGRLIRALSDGVQFIRHKAGLTVRLTKRTRGARRMSAARLSAHHRN